MAQYSGIFTLSQASQAIKDNNWVNLPPQNVEYLIVAGGGGGGQNFSTSAGGGGGAPQFNVVGQGATSQLAEAITGQTQQPIKAYVVSNEVTTAQSLDRNIVQGATIG